MRHGYTLLISILTVCIFSANGQTLGNLKFQLPQLVDRYKMDFDIEGVVFVTAELLENLDLDQYEELRQVDSDVEVYDELTGYNITLYGVDKAIANYNRGLNKRGDDE